MSRASPSPARPHRGFWLSVAGLVLVAGAAYHNSFGGAFVFDDGPAIVSNQSIRRLWPVTDVLFPRLDDGGVTVSGRPLVNLSFAINYSLGRDAVAGYHVVNLLIHTAAGLLLFGVVRRTLLQSALSAKFGASALPLAWGVAALWLVHPLQTSAVTYIVQRAESLMGLCYLLTLYAFIRAGELQTVGRDRRIPPAREPRRDQRSRPTAGRWLSLSVVACFGGMACKEVMATAPLLVLLYDRTFVAGSFGEAWRRRGRYYAALAATWLVLAWLVAGTAGRGGTAGFGTTVGIGDYLLTQCGAIMHYLRLSAWPTGLIFDHGTATAGGLGEVWPQALLLAGLVAATGWALVRRPVWGFLGAWFLVILAPSSSVVPVASQTVAEHRMYLPLAAPLLLAAAGLQVWLGRKAWIAGVAGILACGWLTVQRNADYRSATVLWGDTVAKRPENSRAHNNLGQALVADGRADEALDHYRAAIRLQPTAPEPHYNLGLALAQLNRTDEAMVAYDEALRLQPDYAEAHNNLGNALLRLGRPTEAAARYEQAVRFKPTLADAHSNLANVRLEQGRSAEAIRHGEEAVRLDPTHVEARYNLGNALADAGRFEAAAEQYEAALRLRPDDAEAANNLGNVLAELGRLPEAVVHYEAAVRLRPGFVAPRRNLVAVLAHLGRVREAVVHCRALVQLQPGDAGVRDELARLERLAGR